MKKRLVLLGFVAVLILAISLVAGCKKDKKEEETKATKQTETTTVDPTIGKLRSLLTNEWIDEELVLKRPVAIMFNNIYDGCPQNGIAKAGIIYEAPVEGGICRLMGVFDDYSGLERIGSIRSARTYFPMFANEYDAIYMHHGYAYYAIDALEMVDDLDCGGGYGKVMAYRSDDRVAPHNSFTTPDMIDAGIEACGYTRDYSETPTSHFYFSDEKTQINIVDGITANIIKPGYPVNYPSFEYDPATKLYKRYQYGEAHIDELTGEQLTCKNIILQYCNYSMYEDSPYLNINVSEGGDGMFFTNGMGESITWAKDYPWGTTHYYDMAGNEITLNTGKTWICICLTNNLGAIGVE